MKKTEPKQGAALVASILILALLFVLALIYVAMVRLGNLQAEWGEAESRARSGLDTALARALAGIGEKFDDRVFVIAGQEEDWISEGEGGAVSGLVDADLAADLGWPERYRGTGPGSLADRAARATWETHGDTNRWHLATAWVGVDLTGLLDPFIDMPLPDSFGYELRSTSRPYVTPGEFTAIHPVSVTQVFLPNNLSRDRGWYDAGVWRTDVEVGGRTVGMDMTAWEQEDIRAVFEHLYPDANHDELTAAFLDFRAGADAPTEVDSLTAVPIPMFNEVRADLTITNTANVILVEVQVGLEIWFPNLGNRPEETFRVSESPAILPESIGLSPQEKTPSGWVFETPETPNPFTLLSMTFVSTEAPLPGQVLEIEIPLDNLEIERMSDERVLDRIASELVLRFDNVQVPGDGDTLREHRIFEALDPKLNHRLDMWIAREEDSLGELNAAALEFLAAHPGRGPLYTVLGRPEQGSAVEMIGFFPLDEPWATVNLFGDDGRWFLRQVRNFPRAAGWRRGRINPNSSYEQVLEAVFQSAQVERYPGDPDGRGVTEAESWALAEAMMEEVAAGRGFVQRGDWTKALENSTLWAEWGWDVFQAESLVRQLNERFETSQQYWGLVLMAEWRSPAGVARGRSRAAALIRRDPFADAQERHSWARQLWIPLP